MKVYLLFINDNLWGKYSGTGPLLNAAHQATSYSYEFKNVSYAIVETDDIPKIDISTLGVTQCQECGALEQKSTNITPHGAYCSRNGY